MTVIFLCAPIADTLIESIEVVSAESHISHLHDDHTDHSRHWITVSDVYEAASTANDSHKCPTHHSCAPCACLCCPGHMAALECQNSPPFGRLTQLYTRHIEPPPWQHLPSGVSSKLLRPPQPLPFIG